MRTIGDGDEKAALSRCYCERASLLTALSVLAAIVFGAMLVVTLAEALDAYHRRWR
jgi:hypothetical protein